MPKEEIKIGNIYNFHLKGHGEVRGLQVYSKNPEFLRLLNTTEWLKKRDFFPKWYWKDYNKTWSLTKFNSDEEIDGSFEPEA